MAVSGIVRFKSIGVHIKISEGDVPRRNNALLIASPLTGGFNYRGLTNMPEVWGCSSLTQVDLPGFGQSDCGEHVEYDEDYFSKILWGILDEVDGSAGQTWHIIAHGAACRTAIRMTNMYPESVKSVVCLSPLLSKTAYPFSKQNFDGWFNKNIVDRAAFKRFYCTLAARELQPDVLAYSQKSFLREGAKESLKKAAMHRTELEKLNPFTPSMAIFGDRDTLMDKNARQANAFCLPECENHEMQGVGHLLMETHPRAISDFLRGWFNFIG